MQFILFLSRWHTTPPIMKVCDFFVGRQKGKKMSKVCLWAMSNQLLPVVDMQSVVSSSFLITLVKQKLAKFMAPYSEKKKCKKQGKRHPAVVFDALLWHRIVHLMLCTKSQGGSTCAEVKYKTFRVNCHLQSSQRRSSKVTVQRSKQSANCLAAAAEVRREPERRLSKHFQRSL